MEEKKEVCKFHGEMERREGKWRCRKCEEANYKHRVSDVLDESEYPTNPFGEPVRILRLKEVK